MPVYVGEGGRGGGECKKRLTIEEMNRARDNIIFTSRMGKD